MKKKKKIESTGDIAFGGQDGLSLSLGEIVGRGKPEQKPDEPNRDSKSADSGKSLPERLQGAQQFTLHRETAGRGGRTVVILTVKPSLAEKETTALAKEMRKGLGCGAHVEGGSVVLQGDLQERAAQWLQKAGAKRVVQGN